MVVAIKNGATFEPGVPEPLFAVRLGNLNAWYDFSKDGRFLIPTAVEPAGGVPITVEINWQAGLKRSG